MVVSKIPKIWKELQFSPFPKMARHFGIWDKDVVLLELFLSKFKIPLQITLQDHISSSSLKNPSGSGWVHKSFSAPPFQKLGSQMSFQKIGAIF